MIWTIKRRREKNTRERESQAREGKARRCDASYKTTTNITMAWKYVNKSRKADSWCAATAAGSVHSLTHSLAQSFRSVVCCTCELKASVIPMHKQTKTKKKPINRKRRKNERMNKRPNTNPNRGERKSSSCQVIIVIARHPHLGRRIIVFIFFLSLLSVQLSSLLHFSFVFFSSSEFSFVFESAARLK